MTKMTQRDYFNEIIALAEANEREDLVEFAKGRIAVLDKKSANKKPTKTQEENETIKGVILNTLSETGVTVTELQNMSEVLSGLSNQKVSALLRQMVADGSVVKTVDKKKAYFALAEVEDAE